MENDKINIKLTTIPYQKRKGSILKWTLLLYLIFMIVAVLNTDLDGFLLTTVFLFLLFLLDYTRRLRWVRYSLENLDVTTSGVKLIYHDKDNLLSTTIPWEKLRVTRGTTFTKNPRKIISFKTDLNVVASFYATDNFDNETIDELYHIIKELELANA